MDANNINICTDIVLGLIEFLLLLIYFSKTGEYSSFQIGYYYYLIAAPCFGLLELVKIIIFSKSNVDLTQLDLAESDNTELSINRKYQIVLLFQMLLASLIIISPTLIELILGAISTLVKYALTKNVSVNDLYIIHFTSAFLGLVPLYLKELKSLPPDIILDNPQKTYIFFGIVLLTLVGIALNTLVLISGSLIGLNICNNFVL
jgi:hypothetical protein